MPLGAQVVDTGIIRETNGKLTLERSEGGVWRLEFSRKLRQFVDQRVRVQAVRDDFDLLYIKRVELL